MRNTCFVDSIFYCADHIFIILQFTGIKKTEMYFPLCSSAVLHYFPFCLDLIPVEEPLFWHQCYLSTFPNYELICLSDLSAIEYTQLLETTNFLEPPWMSARFWMDNVCF